LNEGADRLGIPFAAPIPNLCTDNAAMIAFAGAMRLGNGEASDFDLDVYSNADLP
jgi:N6-L-threonylcarbamoyladenine synthase